MKFNPNPLDVIGWTATIAFVLTITCLAAILVAVVVLIFRYVF